MFIGVKRNKNYFVVQDVQDSTIYKYSDNIDDATQFESKSKLESALKKSGFSAHGGVLVIDLRNTEEHNEDVDLGELLGLDRIEDN